MKKIIITALIIIVLIVIAILSYSKIRAIKIDNANKVEFLDEEMGKTISYAAGIDDIKDFRKDDLDKVTRINIGYIESYQTILDIKKCKNLERLIIGFPDSEMSYSEHLAFLEENNIEKGISIEQLQNEIDVILDTCKKINELCLYNVEGSLNLTNIDFLENRNSLTALGVHKAKNVDYTVISSCENLTLLWICYSDIENFDILSEMKNLEDIIMDGTSISNADSLLKLEKLEEISIDNTPLAENEEELNKIREKFKDVSTYLHKNRWVRK